LFSGQDKETVGAADVVVEATTEDELAIGVPVVTAALGVDTELDGPAGVKEDPGGAMAVLEDVEDKLAIEPPVGALAPGDDAELESWLVEDAGIEEKAEAVLIEPVVDAWLTVPVLLAPGDTVAVLLPEKVAV
jgi:hypothetical protein